MQVEPVLKTMMKMAGEKFIVTRTGDTVDGMRNREVATGRCYIALYPDVDVQSGDCLRAVKSGDEFHIEMVDCEICDGIRFQGRAFYSAPGIAPAKIESPPPLRSNSAVNVDRAVAPIPSWKDDYLNYLHALVKVKAGRQSQAFEPFLAELALLLEQDSVQPGALSGFQGLLTENRWLQKAVADVLLGWFTCDQNF